MLDNPSSKNRINYNQQVEISQNRSKAIFFLIYRYAKMKERFMVYNKLPIQLGVTVCNFLTIT